MATTITCKCGAQVAKKLFTGAGVSLLTGEQFFDQDLSGLSAEKLVLSLILASKLLLNCSQCGRYVIVEESGDGDTLQFFKADHDA